MPIADARQATDPSVKPHATIIVPCYQAARHIRYALHSLLSQVTDLRYEIVAVDSSTDGTADIIAADFPEVQLIRSEQRLQVGAARNRGVASARGDIVLFADADTMACPTWIDQMCRPILAGHADAVGGSMRNGTPWSLTGSAGFYLEFFRFLSFDGDPRPARYLVGGNSGFQRSLLEGGAYANSSVGEDMLFSRRLAEDGKRLLFLPRASLTHRNRTGLRTVLLYQYELGRGAFLYRSADSRSQMLAFATAPLLIFLLPLPVMIWIAWTTIRYRLSWDLLRFLSALPVCFVGNYFWAFGFYRSVVQGRKQPRSTGRGATPLGADR